MPRRTRRPAEAAFVAAGLFRLTEMDTPAVGKRLPHPQQEVYTALYHAAQKINRHDLRVLADAFDGSDRNGNPLA